ncbi:MAG: hypothetical protein ACTSUM_04090 [Alphaproteobacteria bacterium]
MRIFRMCCKSEFEKHSNTPYACSRFIFFSNNYEFILNRVLDGKFSNSKFKPEKHAHLIIYNVDSFQHFRKQGKNELILDRRDIPLIKFVREKLNNDEKHILLTSFAKNLKDFTSMEEEYVDIVNENFWNLL